MRFPTLKGVATLLNSEMFGAGTTFSVELVYVMLQHDDKRIGMVQSVPGVVHALFYVQNTNMGRLYRIKTGNISETNSEQTQKCPIKSCLPFLTRGNHLSREGRRSKISLFQTNHSHDTQKTFWDAWMDSLKGVEPFYFSGPERQWWDNVRKKERFYVNVPTLLDKFAKFRYV